MLYGTCCNRSINLVRAAIIIGVYDIVFMLLLVVFHYDFLSNCKIKITFQVLIDKIQIWISVEFEEMFYVSSLSIGIVSAIMLIHGALKVIYILWKCDMLYNCVKTIYISSWTDC